MIDPPSRTQGTLTALITDLEYKRAIAEGVVDDLYRMPVHRGQRLLAEHLVRCAGSNQDTGVEEQQPVGERGGEVQIVEHDHPGTLLFGGGSEAEL